MARDRFSDLERIYDALKLAKTDVSTLPANLDFVKYAKWREGDGVAFTVTRPNLNGEQKVGVIAFGLESTNAVSKKLVTMSGRSYTFWSALGQKAKFGTTVGTGTPPAAPADYFKDGSFVPAKAHVGVKGANSDKTSHITGRKYKKSINAAYTIPVGQTTSKDRFNEVLTDLLGETTLAAYVISLSPEQIRRD